MLTINQLIKVIKFDEAMKKARAEQILGFKLPLKKPKRKRCDLADRQEALAGYQI